MTQYFLQHVFFFQSRVIYCIYFCLFSFFYSRIVTQPFYVFYDISFFLNTALLIQNLHVIKITSLRNTSLIFSKLVQTSLQSSFKTLQLPQRYLVPICSQSLLPTPANHYTEPLTIHQLQFWFAYVGTGSPWRSLLAGICSSKLCSATTCPFLIWGGGQ